MHSSQLFNGRIQAAFESLPLGFWLTTLSSVLYFFAIQMTMPLIPIFITDELGATESFLGTAVIMTTMTEILFRLPVGGWADRTGRLRWIQFGAFVGVFYPAFMAISTNTGLFVVGRLLHGISLAVYVTISRTYVADIVPPEKRGEAFGINTSAFSFALIVSPLVGEYIQQHEGFMTAFWVSTIMAALGFLLTLLLPSYDQNLVKNQQSLFTSIRQVMSERGSWAALLAAVAGGSVFTLFFVFFPSYAKELDLAAQAPASVSTITISLGFMLFAVVNLFAIPFIGRYSDHHGRAKTLVPSVFVLAPALFLYVVANNIWLIYFSITAMSFGFSFFRALMDAQMQDATPHALRGAGTAVLFTVWAASIGIQSQILGIVLDYYGYTVMFTLGSSAAMAFGVAAILMSRTVERERVTRYKLEFPPLPPK